MWCLFLPSQGGEGFFGRAGLCWLRARAGPTVFAMAESSFQISPETLDPGTLRSHLEDPAAGGFVTFEGWVRNLNAGRDVIALEYEVYDDLARKEGARILEEAREQWPLCRVIGVHRSGILQVGDLAVWIGVSAAHRKEAFAACQFIIDELKKRVPIWKKETYADGESDWLKGAG
jgi:molybdopterin synthase catalytic subunit